MFDDVPQFFYDASENTFLDECGDIVDNIFTIFNPNIIYLLKVKKESMFVYTINGEYVELIYEPNYSYIYGSYKS